MVEEAGDPDRDTDGDGIPDRIDLDSDGDGILDILEAGGVDRDGDGRVDDATDSDHDGLADVVDNEPNTPNDPRDAQEGSELTHLPIVDTDGDGQPDYLDLDSDNDGISDLVEGGTDPSLDRDHDGKIDLESDSDGDGVADNVDANGLTLGTPDRTSDPLPDTDSDGVPDYLDLDSDNDGLNDVIEAGGVDRDQDGIIDTPNTLIDPSTLPDADQDGTPDPYQPNNPNLPTDLDWDGDGMIDDATDSDGDGIPDLTDGQPNTFGTDTTLNVTDNSEKIAYDAPTDIDVLKDDTFVHISRITFTQPEHGSVELNDNGTPDDPSDDYFVYTPGEDLEEMDAFIYTLTDPFGNTATAIVTLATGNLPPVVQPDSFKATSGAPVEIDLLANDADPDGQLDPTTIQITQQPQHG